VRHIPVVLENLQDGKILKYPVPKTISVRFRGTGWLLAGLYLSPGVNYFIDASSLGAGDFVVTRRDLLEHLKIPFAIQPLDVNPDTLVLALVEYREKRVQVVPRFMLDFHEGYGQVGPVRVSPESISVVGSDSILGAIRVWHTAFRKFDDLRGPIDEAVELEQSPSFSLQIPTTAVRVRISIQPFAEKTFPGIPVVATGVPPSQEVFFIPPKMDIILRGGIDQLAKITAEELHPTVSFESLAADTVRPVVPMLLSPEEVRVVSRKPEQFQYIIRKRLQ